MGWRTRGSATLKSYNKTKPMLQKGGVKTPQLMDEAQQNTYMIKLFLNRKFDQKLEYTTGTGLKDIMRYSSDFVSIKNVKRLSMEFDWKRIPLNTHDVSFTFENEQFKHLAFETKPIDSIEQFNLFREAWDIFKTSGDFCLKSKKDFDNFAEKVQIMNMPKNKKAYFKNINGAKSRLRRDISRAFKHRKAGFENMTEIVSKTTHKDFCEIMTSVGLSCKVSDMDNAKRYKFIPNATLKTPATEKILNELKKKYFPKLRIEDLLFDKSIEF